MIWEAELCWAGVARVSGYRKACTGRVICANARGEGVEACAVSVVVSHVPWACGSRRLLRKRLHSATLSLMPVAIVYLRVAAAVDCQECHPCARGEFDLCAANRWSRSRMSWVRVITLVVQLFSAKQLPAAPWRQEDIAVHSSLYVMAQNTCKTRCTNFFVCSI